MTKRRRTLLISSVVVAVLLSVWLALALHCPTTGIAFTPRARALHRLKNRTTLPQPADFDARVSLAALLQAGDDTNRWRTDQAARIQGFVIDVAYARPEATNCFSPCARDIHILLAARRGAPKTEQVVIEVTPRMRDWAAGQQIDWSETTLQAQLVNHWCEFEGWMYSDVGHDEESENVAPHRPGNWRATAWELHPVTKITVIK